MKNNYIPLAFCFTLCIAGGLRAQTVDDPTKVDDDGDGLIEIWTLAQLDHMRHNLAGTSYKDSAAATGETTGCGTSLSGAKANKCHGYELMADLDFRAGCGEEGTAASVCTYPAWVPSDNADPSASGARTAAPASGLNIGWVPVGTGTGANAFSGTFEGNGHQIKNLYINATASSGTLQVGLFGIAATIQNLGLTGDHTLVQATVTGSTAVNIGALVGAITSTLRNCYATGEVKGTAGTGTISCGGLLGAARDATIENCYATGDATFSAENNLRVGGLIGISGGTTLKSCYATGDVTASGSAEASGKRVGGLAGQSSVSTITNCYYSGDVPASGVTDSGAGTDVGDLDNLKAPTGPGASGETYEDWSTNSWYFGTSEDLPLLRTFVDNNDDDDNTDDDEQGTIIAGQLSLTPDALVAELRQLVDDYITDVDRAVSGEDYLRVQKLLADLQEVQATTFDKKEGAKKANLSDIYTSEQADERFAPKETTETELTALEGKVKALEDNVGTAADPASADGTGTLFARVKKNENDIAKQATSEELTAQTTQLTALRTTVGTRGDAVSSSGSLFAIARYQASQIPSKANTAALDEARLRVNALESAVGDKPPSGTADNLWKETEALKKAIRAAAAIDLSDYVKKADLPPPTDLSPYVSQAELDALGKRIAALESRAGGTAARARLATRLDTRVVAGPPQKDMFALGQDRLVVQCAAPWIATLLNDTGRAVWIRRLLRGEQSLDLSGLAAGRYVLVLRAEGGGLAETYAFVKE